MPMSEKTAETFAQKLLSAYASSLPPRRISNYARRIARFSEETAHASIEHLVESCKTCPSIAEMLDDMYRREPRTAERLRVLPPQGFPQWSPNPPAPRPPKTQDAINSSRTQATAWLRLMLQRNPRVQCSLCQEDIGSITNLSKFTERCAHARYGDVLDASLLCDGCLP